MVRPRVGPGLSAPVPAAAPVGGPAAPDSPAREPTLAAEATPARSKTQRLAGIEAPNEGVVALDRTLAIPPPAADPVSFGEAVPLASGPTRGSTRSDTRGTGRTVVPWVLLGMAIMVVIGSGVWLALGGRLGPGEREAAVEPDAGAVTHAAVVPVRSEPATITAVADERNATPRPETTGPPSEPVPAAAAAAEAPKEPLETVATDPSDESAVIGTGDPSEPPPPRSRAKQALSIVAADALGAVVVEVRSKAGDFKRRYEFRGRNKGERIATGSYSVRWRRVDDSRFGASQRIVLRRGCDLRIVLAPSGMTTVPMGSACR